jgi:hypothetical protein
MNFRCSTLRLATCALVVTACGSSPGDDPRAPPPAPAEGAPAPAPAGAAGELVLQLGADVAPVVRARLEERLGAVVKLRLAAADEDLSGLGPGAEVIAIGETTAARAVIPDADVAGLREEGYVLKSGPLGEAAALAVRGSQRVPAKGTKAGAGTRATAYGAYAALEELGFAFLHPLAAARPDRLTMSSVLRREEPRWPIRGLQLHTMHPLELTNLLQGWGVAGPDDAAGWAAMLPEWDAFLEWMLANGQNQVHWLLLEAEPWSDFAMSRARHDRLVALVERAHAFGVTVGIDVPLVLRQQNTFRLIVPSDDPAKEKARLASRVDWLMSAGFDYVATESGTTEFTHPSAHRMLGWMNDLTERVADVHGKPTYVKLHCSTGQVADDFIDPSTGAPINFNYLPHFADPRLGVLAHTVQFYGLDDPAPTYGNRDFGYVRDLLEREVGEREVLWHPETAYWVSFDDDVPLFLPLYAERRLHDLRLLGQDEEGGRMGRGAHAGERMDGQSTFSSGWEWSYWLNDVVTARAAWNPRLDAATDEAALAGLLDEALRVFGDARRPVRDLVIETARVEHELLIEGRVNGAPPASVERRAGQAYLQGFETWDDVSAIGSRLPGMTISMTQPERLGLVEMRAPLHPGPRYTGEIELLLTDMEARFADLFSRWSDVRAKVPPAAIELFDDLLDSMHVTALRARQIHGLYDYVDMRSGPTAPRLARLATARAALDEAAAVVGAREPRYRVPADRIASWGTNPTAYRFGYLWTVRTLYYWWRDEGLAVDAPLSPCYLNVLSMADVALGESAYGAPADILRSVLDNPASGGGAAECASAPVNAPAFPPYGLRSRP